MVRCAVRMVKKQGKLYGCLWAVMLGLLLPACTSLADYDHYLARYLGYSQNNLIEVLGKPARIWSMDSRVYMLYQTGERATHPFVEGLSDASGHSVYTGQACETVFILEHDAVFAWRYQGDRCKAE